MVTVYTQNNCAKCMMTKNVLESEGIAFKAINLDTDVSPEEAEAKRQEFRDLGFLSMPVVIKDGMEPAEYITGFQPDRLKELA